MQTQENPSDSEESFDSLDDTSQNEETGAVDFKNLLLLDLLSDIGAPVTVEPQPLSSLEKPGTSGDSATVESNRLSSLLESSEPSDDDEPLAAEPSPFTLSDILSDSGESVTAESKPLSSAEKPCDSGESVAAETKQLLSLETVDRIMKLPVVETAWQQGQDVYGKIKNFNALFNWAFSTTECAIQRTSAIAAPLVHKFNRPIQFVDRSLAKGIDTLEKTAPIIKETPQQIFEQTKTCVMETVQTHYDLVRALKDVSLRKVNAVLATKYGSKAVNCIDSTSALAEKIIDYCFPVGKDEIVVTDDSPISAEENPVMHTIQTVGRLTNKVTSRIYGTVLCQVVVLRKQDIHEYVTSLVAILRISLYLNLLIGKGPPAITASNEESVALKNSS